MDGSDIDLSFLRSLCGRKAVDHYVTKSCVRRQQRPEFRVHPKHGY
jgi:hypothetical protein